MSGDGVPPGRALPFLDKTLFYSHNTDNYLGLALRRGCLPHYARRSRRQRAWRRSFTPQPQHFRQLGDVGRDAPRLVAGQQLGDRALEQKGHSQVQSGFRGSRGSDPRLLRLTRDGLT